MWWRLFTAPWPEKGLPNPVLLEAVPRIRRYWRVQMWLIVLGEVALWLITQAQGLPHARSYALPALLMGGAYCFGLLPFNTVWLTGVTALFLIQGMLLQGLGPATALSLMLPYNVAAMILTGRRRVFVQACCVIGFWFSLLYSILHIYQLAPPGYLQICYNILLATLTFQALRFLNQLAVDLSMAYVEREVTQQVTERSQQFLARVSHELRTPLNSVLGFAKLIRRTELAPTQSAYLAQIIEEGEQLNRLVSDLLDSAQLSAGRLILAPDVCDVNAICRAVADEIHSILKPTVTLSVEFTPELPTICADTLRVRQIVRNLVSNAAKYTAHGHITIRTAYSDGWIQVLVDDSGPGIPADQYEFVFVPFVKRDSRSPGVGLGLDIARQLARLHGGDIHLQSIVGQGSVFTIALPIEAVTTITLPSLPAPSQST